MSILVSSYTEPGYKPILSIRLTDDEYSRTLQSKVPGCADVAVIHRDHKLIYLAQRLSKPMTGWWWIGGGMAPDDTKEAAAIRNFKRETGLELSSSRLELAAVLDYRWKDRAQLPQEIGCHMMAYTFVVELTAEELLSSSANLDPIEYERGVGLVPFNRNQLVEDNVAPPILWLYDHVFGT